MDRPGSHAVVLTFLFFLVTLAPGTAAAASDAGDSIAPQRNISVIADSPADPEWKVLWDEARELAHAARFQEAEKIYEKFFAIKNNVTEAQWEYCKVLFQVGNLDKAEKLIATLLEKNPYRQEYLMQGGEIAYLHGDYQLAAHRFGLGYEYDPTAGDADLALKGIARSMKKLGRADIAITLNQQLLTRHPEDVSLYRHLGQDAVIIGDLETAGTSYDRLLEKLGISSVETTALYEMLTVYAGLNLQDREIGVLKELIKRNEETVNHRKRLVSIFTEAKRYDEAVEQLSLLYVDTGDSHYLKRAGDISLLEMNRPDKALAYFEQLLELEVNDRQVAKTIVQIQQKLAADFLPIVENGGAALLWMDLLDITENRLAIYLEIAKLLEAGGKLAELVELYSILHQNYPSNDEISWKLAANQLKSGELKNALATLNSISDAKKDSTFFLNKADVEQGLGLEQDSLLSAIKALQVSPGDEALQLKCLRLAGRLGLAKILEEIYQPLSGNDNSPNRAVVMEYLGQLANNGLYTRFFSRLCQARNWYSYLPDFLNQLDLLYARVLTEQGRGRDAEQLLRLMFVEKRAGKWPLLLLVEKALDEKNIRDAEKWYAIMQAQHSRSGKDNESIDILLRTALLRQNFRKYHGEEDFLSQEIKRFITDTDFTAKDQPLLTAETQSKLIKQFCGHPEVGHNPRLMNKCRQFVDTTPGSEPAAEFLRQQWGQNAATPKGRRGQNSVTKNLLIHGNAQVATILDLVASEMDVGMSGVAKKHLELIGEGAAGSARACFLSCRLDVTTGELDSAITSLEVLCRQFPQEEYFFATYLEAKIRKGFYSSGLSDMYERYGRDEDSIALARFLVENGQKREALLLARLLWGNRDHQKALQIYELLLTPSALDIVSSQVNSRKINHLEFSLDRSFWSSMLALLQAQPDILQDFMEPDFLANNIGNETSTIVATQYGLYSWQKFVHREYMARKAIYDKNYYFAEQSYQKLIAEDNSEGLKDLAQIYSRLGKHRKEAQVYETIQRRGEGTPEIINSIERTSIQLSPQNSGELEYSKKEGRGGLVDMSTFTFGSSFLFTPDLNIDARFRYTSNHYEAVNSDDSAGSNSMYGSTNFEIFRGYEVDLGAGTEKINGKSDFSLLYRLGMRGQLDQFFNAYVFVDRQPVTDTVSAIRHKITKQRVETGLNCETPVGISFGGAILHSDFTGSNNSNQFDAFSSYSIFGDDMLLSFRYDYEYISGSTDDFVDLENNDNDENSVLYWLPSTYNQHKLSMRFKQDFLGYKTKDKEAISYYQVEGGVGYEDGENVVYSGGVAFFLEMNPHFLLNGKFNFSQSSEYEETGLLMSLFYRW